MPQTTRFAVDCLQPVEGQRPTKSTVRLPALASWAKGTVLGFVTGTGSPVSEQHTLTVTSTPSGTFILQWAGPLLYQTGAITYSGTAATMVANLQAAMDALFGAGNTLVAGTSPYTITFQGAYANKNIPVPTVISSLSGGSIAATETQVGHPGSGLAKPYASGNSDGTQNARVVLIKGTQTNILGQLIENLPGESQTSTEVFTGGDFNCADLVGLDATAVAALGRLINANSLSAPGAILRLN